jgi:hypothetical protein
MFSREVNIVLDGLLAPKTPALMAEVLHWTQFSVSFYGQQAILSIRGGRRTPRMLWRPSFDSFTSVGYYRPMYLPNSLLRHPNRHGLAGLALALALMVILGMTTGCAHTASPTPLPRPATAGATPLAAQRAAPTATETPRDATPPRITLEPLPEAVQADEGLKVVATANDDVAVTWMRLYLDGVELLAVPEPSLRHNLDTRRLSPGPHMLRVEAQDAAGNVASQEASFRLDVAESSPSSSPTRAVEPPATPLPSPTVVTTVRPSATMAAPLAVTTAAPTPTTPAPVSVSWGKITIATYAYRQALYTDPNKAGHPYALLHHDRVGPAEPVTYRTLVLRNAYLELTFLPELGGRLYQGIFLPTGQALFYNNPVIKPTHWGPEDQGWWLAVGGIEFCLPVNEHGYLTAEPWTARVTQGSDGSATAWMEITEQSRQIAARIGVTLRPGRAAFEVSSELQNQSGAPQRLQYWINGMLSPGHAGVTPSLRFYYPTDRMQVHSRGDASLPDAGAMLSWPIHQGRDLSLYGNWRNWLGLFALETRAPFSAVYDPAVELGVVRVYPPDMARGAKLFAFGQGFEARLYTDDGSQYVEMWGGWTPTFWDDGELAPGQSLRWSETWYPIWQIGGVSQANERLALQAAITANTLNVGVFATEPTSCKLEVMSGSQVWAERQLNLSPTAPYQEELPLPVGNTTAPVTVRMVNAQQQVLLMYSLGS